MRLTKPTALEIRARYVSARYASARKRAYLEKLYKSDKTYRALVDAETSAKAQLDELTKPVKENAKAGKLEIPGTTAGVMTVTVTPVQYTRVNMCWTEPIPRKIGQLEKLIG